MDTERPTQLSILIAEIEKLLSPYLYNHSYNPSTQISAPGTIPLRSNVINRLILSELFDIATILRLIDTATKRLWLVQQKEHSFLQDRDTISVGAEYLVERQKMINERGQILNELSLFIKSLYEWLYHLKELLEKKDFLQQGLKNELESFCAFRRKLITHKGGSKGHGGVEVDLGGGFVYCSDLDNVLLIMLPLSISYEVSNHLDNLFEQCKPELDPEHKKEENWFKKWEILSQNLPRLRAKRDDLASFIGSYGGVSASPLNIAEFFKELLKEIIPKLGNKKPI